MKILHSDLPKFNQFAEYVVESTPEIIEKNIVIGAEKCRVPLSNFVDGSSESLETVLKAYQESDELKAVELDDTETEALKEKYHEDVITYATQKKSAVDVLEKLKEIAGYPDWQDGESVEVGDVRMFETNLYTVIQAHKTQSDWTPPKVPALWKKFYTADVIPEWIQPTGAHDAYNIGDRVIYKDTIYVSAINGNVWSPVAYPAGWTVVKEIVKIDTVEKIDLTIKK